jgi:hypothetical protein
MRGPTSVFWAALTPFPLQLDDGAFDLVLLSREHGRL